MLSLLDSDTGDILISDSLKRIKGQLAQIPEGKTAVLVATTEWKWGFVPVVNAGIAVRTPKGWEIHGEGFISKADKGVRGTIVKAW